MEEECACRCGPGPSRGCQCGQQHLGPAEMVVADREPAPVPEEQHVEADRAAPRSLQDLPEEMLEKIFALLPGTDLGSLAQACRTFRRILHTDIIWSRRCREEYGMPENLPERERMGISYREVYVNMFPYRHILGLWQLNDDYTGLLNVEVDGLGFTGWRCSPPSSKHVDAPMQAEASFRIRLTERNSAMVECMERHHSTPHSTHMQIQKDRFTAQCNKIDHRKDSPTQLRGEQGRVLPQEDRQQYGCLTYRRIYLPPSHPDDLIRPGLFQGEYHEPVLTVVMLSFHGKYARVTKITGDSTWRFEIHLMRRIQLPDGQNFRDFKEFSSMVEEIDKQVREQQQQQEDGTEESQGQGWQSPAQPGAGEYGAAALEEQPVPFVLPVEVNPIVENYPQNYRMGFFAMDTVTVIRDDVPSTTRYPGVFILFDEDRFGFIWLVGKHFTLYRRVQNTFQNAEAPSPQAFLEMLSNIQSRPL